MEPLNLDKFDPNVADLHAIVAKTKNITASDLEDASQMAVVRQNRINLKNARVQIEKTGKAMRDDAIKYQRAVIAKEKELVAIIEPEEDRLQAIETEAKAIAEMKKREKELPARRTVLDEMEDHDKITITDAEILRMDDIQFSTYVNQRQASIMEKEREEIEARERAVKEAEDKALRDAQRAVELKEAEERARQEERDRAELEAKRAEERRIAEEARVKAVAEAEERALQAEKAYQSFLITNGFQDANKADWHIVRTGTEVKLYKHVATYKQ